jgi:energy-coupling factor transport system substrate-specific component
MKKIIGYLIVFTYVIGVILMTYYNYNIDKIIELGAVFFIVTIIIMFEIKEVDSKTMAVLAILGALGGVFRIPFAAIPGLQPTTFIAAIAGYTLGPINGFMVGAASAFISNFFLGQGPWTLWQMMGWGLCGFFFGLLRKLGKKEHFLHFVIFCFIWGYIYGIILDLWFVLEFIRPFSMKAWFTGFASSFYFDTIHAFGNIIFSLIFGRKFLKILGRYKRKFSVEYIE